MSPGRRPESHADLKIAQGASTVEISSTPFGRFATGLKLGTGLSRLIGA